jgi:hypothetical protein
MSFMAGILSPFLIIAVLRFPERYPFVDEAGNGVKMGDV